MPSSSSIPPVVRFGTFELDVRSGELRRQGVRVKLQEQPLRILLMLLENPGQIVTREELRARIWPADTFVEFDQGVYSALRRLREALADSADSPRYVETVPRRGYRFIAPVERNGAGPEAVGRTEPAEAPQFRKELATESGAQPGSEASRKTLRFGFPSRKAAALLAAALLAGAGIGFWLRLRQHMQIPVAGIVTVQRLTDFVGMEEFPAISPDGKTVAFTADKTGQRQIWVRLISGGTPLQITRDDSDHRYPRWTPDSSALIYYSAAADGEEQGTLWEVSALGGTPRTLAHSVSGADVSHDGKKLAFFRLNENKHVELVTSDRETSVLRVVAELSPPRAYEYPRWSPDDRRIAFIVHSTLYTDDVAYVPVTGGNVQPITRDRVLMSGFSWLPDGSGVVYSSARESTVIYLPTMHLWLASLDGSAPRQLTYGETSLHYPDVDRSGRIVASRLKMQFGIWKYPVGGDAKKNVQAGEQLTHETGQVQTPNIGPGDRELAYLSDDGAHGNIWIMDLQRGATRQITSEHDPRVAVGLPVWSPDGSTIALVSTRDTLNWDTLGLWLIHPDGSALRRLVAEISGYPTWSGDGRWLYYSKEEGGIFRVWKIPAQGGAAVLVRNDNAIVGALDPASSTIYYLVPQLNGTGNPDYEIRMANPENGPTHLLGRIAGDRVPHWQVVQPTLSHDNHWLALPLNDGATTNLYALSTTNGAWRRVTDFDGRRTFIVRRVSWSSDDRYLFAAVGDGDADIVQIDGIISGR